MHWGSRIFEKIYDLRIFTIVITSIASVMILSKRRGLKQEIFDNVSACQYAIPTHWDIGKVYKRLIKAVAEHEKQV